VTTEEPVLSTALVMKDFFEYILTSLIFDVVNGWGFRCVGHIIPSVITEKSNNFLWL